MTIFLTPEELNRVLMDSAFIHKTAEAIGLKTFKVTVYPTREGDREGFEIDVEETVETKI